MRSFARKSLCQVVPPPLGRTSLSGCVSSAVPLPPILWLTVTTAILWMLNSRGGRTTSSH